MSKSIYAVQTFYMTKHVSGKFIYIFIQKLFFKIYNISIIYLNINRKTHNSYKNFVTSTLSLCYSIYLNKSKSRRLTIKKKLSTIIRNLEISLSDYLSFNRFSLIESFFNVFNNYF